MLVSRPNSFAEAIASIQDTASTDRVNAAIQGDIRIPSRICTAPAEVGVQGTPNPDMSGFYSGTLTNPDSSTTWTTDVTLEQCGPLIHGLFKHTSSDGFANRRFEGNWREGRLSIQAAYPYIADSTRSVGAWCENVEFQLQVEPDQLSGTWSASNCPRGGVLDVVRTTPTEPVLAADPALMPGTWTGPVDQPSSSRDYSVKMTVSTSTEGTLEGPTMYPELNCSGTLAYERESDGYVVFQESLVTGLTACTNNGFISVRLHPNDALEWLYRRYEDAPATASAQLV